YVDSGTMVDSHALIGSCAQIGKRVHVSAAAQIGGVLEPVNASPVVIEDDALVGGNCGVYEGTIVRARAVLAAGGIPQRGALGEGPSRITRILESADVHSTAGVLRALGYEVPALSPSFTVKGIGPAGARQPTANLDCGNSGTTTRLMAGVVAALPVSATFVG